MILAAPFPCNGFMSDVIFVIGTYQHTETDFITYKTLTNFIRRWEVPLFISLAGLQILCCASVV
jgi:hypothetical protein